MKNLFTKQNIPNLITSLRIFLSLSLIFLTPFSIHFIVIYLLIGLSDVLDGFIARKCKTASEFGSKLDTLADFIFFVVSILKIYPYINFSNLSIALITVITLIKITNIVLNKIKTNNEVVDIHSFQNKLTGILIFLIPMFIEFSIEYYAIDIICIIAIFAAIDESISIIKFRASKLNPIV